MNFYEFCIILEEAAWPAHEDDEYEHKVAEWCYRGVSAAVRRYIESGRKDSLSSIFVDLSRGKAKALNKGSTDDPKWVVQIPIPETLEGVSAPGHMKNEKGPFDLRLEVGTGKAQLGAEYSGGADHHGRLAWTISIYVDMGVLNRASGVEDRDVQMMLLRLHKQIVHEVTHMSSGKSSSEEGDASREYRYGKDSSGRGSNTPEYNKAKIMYYTGDAELRAHARQFALLYSRYYPGRPFDMAKMERIASVDDKYDRYFKGFDEEGESNIWGFDVSPYRDVLKRAKDRFLPMVKHFVDQRSRPMVSPQIR